MTIEDIRTEAQCVISYMLPDVDTQEISADTDIFSLGLDSINAMSLIFGLQDAFEITFDTSEISFENFRTLANIVDLISQKEELKQASVNRND